ncbi:hypothetical protein [Desulfosporosinus orientis]|uniref:hypothetical protein n=1 Tax=Desulfosporosinus orientis TaxID=1563 RepID=UPI001FA79F34|nr:hypothetical protein [Desulfosporosinus orientis]
METKKAEFPFDPEGKITWEILIPVKKIILVPSNSAKFKMYINLGFIVFFVLNKFLVEILTHDQFKRMWAIKRTKMKSPAISWKTSPVPEASCKSKNTRIIRKSRVILVDIVLFILSAPFVASKFSSCLVGNVYWLRLFYYVIEN